MPAGQSGFQRCEFSAGGQDHASWYIIDKVFVGAAAASAAEKSSWILRIVVIGILIFNVEIYHNLMLFHTHAIVEPDDPSSKLHVPGS